MANQEEKVVIEEGDVPTDGRGRVVPHVKYKMVKWVRGFVGEESVKHKATKVIKIGYLRVDGCHGTTQNLAQFERNGAIFLGHGALDPKKHKEALLFVNSRTGEGIDPDLQAALNPSVMDERVAKMTKVRNAEAQRNA